MHKKFYVSGFLFHLETEQILLQHDASSQNLLSQWFLFGSSHAEKEAPEVVFKKVISDLLHVKIDTVLPVYSREDENANQNIVYGLIETVKEFSPKNGFTFQWFTFKEIDKLKIIPQTKHDIVVGQRVINAAGRKLRGEHTFQ